MRLLATALAVLLTGCAVEDPKRTPEYNQGWVDGFDAAGRSSGRVPTRQRMPGQRPFGELRAAPDTTDPARLPASPRAVVFEVWASDPTKATYQVELDHGRWYSVHEADAGPSLSPLRWFPDDALQGVLRGRSVRVILDRQTAESDSGTAWALVYLETKETP